MANMEYAFDTVLDRLVEAEKRVAAERERNSSSSSEVELLKRDLNNARSDLTTAKVKLQKFEKADDVFVALYDAAAKAQITLTKNRTEDFAVVAEMLEDTVAAARKFIDPIPF